MKKYINKHLEKSFIRLSLSAAIVLVLLVKKPEDGLKFCVDYRVLSVITVNNKYSILLINEILNKLSNVRQFTKLDIIYAFNKICIKKGQKWLMVFNTRYSKFEYLIMPFELCNVPEMYQSYINNLLQK